MKKSALILFLWMIARLSFSQDAQFAQFYAAPLYFNPAFAGTDSSARLGFIHRNEWKPNAGLFTTFDMEYDQHVNALHGGFGVMAWKDVAGSGIMSTTNFSGMYSFQQHVYKEFNISIGIQAAWMQGSIDWSKLAYIGQNINPRFPETFNNTQEVAPKGTIGILDISSGIEFYTNEFYGGLSIAHLTEPDKAFIGASVPLPLKFTTNIGAMIPVDSSGKSVLYFCPNLIIINQKNFHQIDAGVNFQGGGNGLDILDVGIWYRYNEAMIGILSIHKWGLRLSYSYDLAIGKRLSPSTLFANEISLGYKFHSKPKNTGFHPINCSSF